MSGRMQESSDYVDGEQNYRSQLHDSRIFELSGTLPPNSQPIDAEVVECTQPISPIMFCVSLMK
jgi:hypothetical protein